MLDPGGRPTFTEADELRRLIEHVFLPRKLPGKESKSVIQDEANILSLFTSVITTSDYHHLLPVTTRNLFKTWSTLQSSGPPTPENISKALGNLKKGCTFGYYVRAQNAGILIYADTDQEATFCTFPSSLKSEIVMSNCLGEVVGVYPEQSIKIPNSNLLRSEAVARQIVTLTNQEILDALPKSKKAGSEQVEVREVADTLYVSEWLTCLLSNATSRQRTDTEFPKVCKKVRDQVVWKSCLIPFRRSGMWMTVKVILQLSLCKSATSEKQGKFLYKLTMAEFMRQMCELAEGASMESDIGMFMLKKLARRVKKVQTLEDTTNASEINQLLLSTNNTCKKFKMEMLKGWQTQMVPVLLPELQIDLNDIKHTKLPLIPSLNALSTFTSTTRKPPTNLPRVQLSANEFPNIKSMAGKNPSKEMLGNILFETESWILNKLDHCVHSGQVIQIQALASEYVEIGTQHHKGNPVSESRMVLTFLKIVQVLDQIAVKCYPMLKEHKTGVNPGIIQQLLLPYKVDLELAHQLELYFGYRNQQAKFPALTEEDAATAHSFSVRYAQQDLEMTELRDKILLDAEHEILVKQGELKFAKELCVQLREKMRNMSCACNGNNAKVCGYHTTKEILDSQRVKVYERPLRSESVNQFAVVFELLIPPEIACFRDVVRLLYSNVCRGMAKSYRIDGRIWTKYDRLRRYSKGMEVQRYFQLGSTSKLFVDSHYREQHPDHQESAFIVNNGYNCTFAGNYDNSWNVKEWCTLKVEKNSLYSDLQWTLETTSHFQNEVLARQVECPEKLRLSEYKDFGSLRAGHRLQLRNIYRALVEKSLSLKEESVFALICQAVWEAGPPDKNWYEWYDRESHEDLANDNFAQEWVQELTNQLETYKENWTEAYTLLLIIVLGCRSLEFGRINSQISEFLLKCRKTGLDWIRRIEEMISKSFDCPSEHVQKLRMKLLDACICVCWTFSVGPEYVDLILTSEKDVFLWTHALARIYNITCSSITTLSDTRKILISNISNVSLNIESKLKQFVGPGLDIFVRENWKEGSDGVIDDWEPFLPPAAHVYQTTFHRNKNHDRVHLQVDVLRGSFLVNGLPVGYLPEDITKNPTFTRVFQNIVFEVFPAYEEKTFVTSHRYNDSDYRFSLLPDESTLIIRERNRDGPEFQLIPDKLFYNLIPHILIRDYSHWLNLNENWIDFRPVLFGQFEKQKPKYRFYLSNKELVELSTGKRMFSVSSPTHLSTTKYLARLENSKYIHTILDSDHTTVTVHLPRMRLTFKVKEETQYLENLEYAMAVRPKQSFGTLIGLSNGLLMQNEHGEQKLLIPHGKVQVSTTCTPKKHQQVSIDLENLENPPVFLFDLDYRLKQLRGGKNRTGWIYLAYLHSMTSSALEDPFTELTGTEEAFRILQSGHSWSCMPYEDQQAIEILEKIKNLSPIRTYYPSHLKRMEQVEWPTGIPSCAAQDGFSFIVDKLLEDSKRLEALFKNGKTESNESTDDEDSTEEEIELDVLGLSKRAYIRYEPLSSIEGKVSTDFLKILPDGKICTTGINGRSWITSPEQIMSTRVVSESGHSWHYKPQSSAVSLENFLVTRDGLCGSMDPVSLTKMSIVELLRMDFRNNWIDLYELARLSKKQNLRSEWTTILSILAFRGIDLNHLLLLQGVAVHTLFFQAQHSPKHELFEEPTNSFNESKLQQIFSKVTGSNWQVLTNLVAVLWPIKSVDSNNFGDLFSAYNEHIFIGAIEKVNVELELWSRNLELLNFVKKVEQTFPRLAASSCLSISPISKQPADALLKSFGNTAMFELDFTTMVKDLDIDASPLVEIYNSGFYQLPHISNESELEGPELLEHLENQKTLYKRFQDSRFKILFYYSHQSHSPHNTT